MIAKVKRIGEKFAILYPFTLSFHHHEPLGKNAFCLPATTAFVGMESQQTPG